MNNTHAYKAQCGSEPTRLQRRDPSVYTSCKSACVRIYALLFTFLRSASLAVCADLASERTLLHSTAFACALRCLTEAVPLPNLHGSKVQLGKKLGLLVQSLCARSRSPTFTLVKMTGSYPSQVRKNAYAKPLPAAAASVQPLPGMWEGLGIRRWLLLNSVGTSVHWLA